MKGLKEIFYWNKYKVIPKKNEVGTNDNSNYIRELLDGSYQGNKRFFVLTYDNTEGDNQVLKIFFQELKLKITALNLMKEVFMISQLMS